MFSTKFWFLDPISRGEVPVLPPLRTPMLRRHIDEKNLFIFISKYSNV